MAVTPNLGLSLVDDSTLLRSAVSDLPNGNAEALDLALAQLVKAHNELVPEDAGTRRIVFASNYGRMVASNMPGAISEAVKGSLIVVPGNVPYMEGAAAEFGGWSDTANGQIVAMPYGLLTVDGSSSVQLNLYARWKRDRTFYPNGADGSEFTEFTLAAPECPFSRDGYAFKEWNTKADGSGHSNQPGEAMFGVNFEWYAIWEETT